MRSQAHPDRFSLPLWVLGWSLVLIAIGLVTWAGWFVLAWFLSLASYIPS